jgi:hypothetical protein
LLSVAVEHNYNLNSICTCLEFTPTKKTQSLLDNAGLIFKKTTDGIRIIYDEDNLECLELYVQDVEEPLSFDFKVYSKDLDFKSYSEPHTIVADSILYFDNLSTSGTGKQNLSVSKFVSSKDVNKMDSTACKEILSQKEQLLPPEFIVRIFANNDKGQLLDQWIGSEATIYSITFDTRRRYWKYYLLGQLVSNKKSSKDFCIVDPDKQVEFEATGEELLSNQSLAYTYRSKQQIRFSDNYPFRFQLRQKNQDDEIVVINHLPVANVKQIGTDTVANQKTVVAEIYINS